VKSSENVSCQDTASNRNDKRTSYNLSCLLVVLLISSFFPDCSNNNVTIDPAGQVLRSPPLDTKNFLSGNIQYNTDESFIHPGIDTILTAEVMPEQFKATLFFQHIETELFGFANLT
jgi:hypothetical protein